MLLRCLFFFLDKIIQIQTSKLPNNRLFLKRKDNLYYFQVQTCPLFKSRPVLLKDLDRFGHPLLRDAQLASFLVTSVDNNIYFGAPASSVTKIKKKETKKRRQLYQSSVFSRSLSLKKCYNLLQQSVKSPIAKIPNYYHVPFKTQKSARKVARKSFQMEKERKVSFY